jgi:glutamine cyclotransferase
MLGPVTRVRPLTVVLVALLALAGCGDDSREPAASASAVVPTPDVARLKVEVLQTLPHDTAAFTQGLELAGDRLYEGTGLSGQSSLRVGAPGENPSVTEPLPAPLFGEGITVLDATVWQLTWQDGVAFERDARTLRELRQVRYEGEGWGLCHQDSGRLVMSNGSADLTFRDPKTFAPTGTVTVTADGSPVTQLNELECVGDDVYANLWGTDSIVRINPATGRVTAHIDAAGLLTPEEKAKADVLNGIAAVPGTDEFLVTGKLWPKLFRVRFVP